MGIKGVEKKPEEIPQRDCFIGTVDVKQTMQSGSEVFFSFLENSYFNT